MVLSPGDRSGLATERYTQQLTSEATRAGFVVVYADNRPRTIPSQSRPISKQWILELGTIPKEVAEEWCIDEERVFLTGHSNGGTASIALSLLETSPHSPAAIAVSGAGFRKVDLSKFQCVKPKPIMVMHSDNDNLFPGYGAEIADWWADCNRCSKEKKKALGDGCVEFEGCAARTVFCRGTGGHTRWPGRNAGIIDFLRSVNPSGPGSKNPTAAGLAVKSYH